ncbi:MAG: epoxide hydrolase family protein [Betaproteobacteria bacterium]
MVISDHPHPQDRPGAPAADFRIRLHDRVLADLARRLDATRWPESFDEPESWATGTDRGYLQGLVEYWRTGFDWRAQEDGLNAWPQFSIEIAGARVHFVHVRGKGPRPLPIVLTHGWPSSFMEMLRLIPLLTDPARHGADPGDSFDVVVPSVPGYAFSSRPNGPVTADSVAAAWVQLMSALGHDRFAAHGGDIGSGITTALGRHYPDRLVGIHLLAVRDPDVAPGDPLRPEEEAYLRSRAEWREREGAYSHLQRTKPQTLAYALHDSPVGLAAWLVEKFRAWSDCGGRVETCFTKDWLLSTITLYWATETIHSSIRYYAEGAATDRPEARVDLPTAVALFPRDLLRPPRCWAERLYNVQRWTEMPRGGHFAAHEQPELLAADLRAFFGPLRGRDR